MIKLIKILAQLLLLPLRARKALRSNFKCDPKLLTYGTN